MARKFGQTLHEATADRIWGLFRPRSRNRETQLQVPCSPGQHGGEPSVREKPIRITEGAARNVRGGLVEKSRRQGALVQYWLALSSHY
jgi:hypothetical protein